MVYKRNCTYTKLLNLQTHDFHIESQQKCWHCDDSEIIFICNNLVNVHSDIKGNFTKDRYD
jgi:hypothetical protein